MKIWWRIQKGMVVNVLRFSYFLHMCSNPKLIFITAGLI